MGLDDLDRIDISSRAELRRWLADNHEQRDSAWALFHKKHVTDKHVPYDDFVEELLCFGWIDSTVRRVDADRVCRLISPRKPGSMWSGKNKRHVEDLEARGLMTPAGWRAIERAKADGSWTILDDVEALIEPDDLANALDALPEARRHWDGFPASVKRGLLWWIKSARRDATRQRRVEAIVSEAAEGRRAGGP